MPCAKSRTELVWKYERFYSIPFLKSSILFHFGIFHIPYRNFRSIRFHALDPSTKFWSIDVPMMPVLQYVTVLNRLFDDFAYFADVFVYDWI